MRSRKRIILVGPAASGKTTLANSLVKFNLSKDIQFTTRPPRSTEIPSEDYKFITKTYFNHLLASNNLTIVSEHNNWMYGTDKESWNSCDVFILTPSQVKSLSLNDRDDSLVVYLDILEEDRIKRLWIREDSDTVDRRIKKDRKDFSGFIDYDYRIKMTNFDIDKWCSIIIKST